MIYIIIQELEKKIIAHQVATLSFKIRVNVRNNIYSTQSNDQIKTFNYYSNSGTSALWDWSSGNGNNTFMVGLYLFLVHPF